jgi:hypothetical protein
VQPRLPLRVQVVADQHRQLDVGSEGELVGDLDHRLVMRPHDRPRGLRILPHHGKRQGAERARRGQHQVVADHPRTGVAVPPAGGRWWSWAGLPIARSQARACQRVTTTSCEPITIAAGGACGSRVPIATMLRLPVRIGSLAASPMHICRAEKYRADSVTEKANASVCRVELEGCWREWDQRVSMLVGRLRGAVQGCGWGRWG